MNLIEILNYSKEYLEKLSFQKPRLESEKLIAHVLKLDRISLYAYFDKELTNDEKNEIKHYLTVMKDTKKTFDQIVSVDEDQDDHKNENIDILNKSIKYLEDHGVPNSKIDAEYIFSYVLNVNRMMLGLNFKRKITEEQKEQIRKLLKERGEKRRPLQYLLGEWEFYGYKFKLDERVLIPRNDTEVLVEQCKHILLDKKDPHVLDIGCGSGAISIALGKELPNSVVLGADISDGALEVALENRDLNNANNVDFIKSDIFSNIGDRKFTMIVSNPPYISVKDYMGLMPEVLNYEPKMALTDDGDGLSFYEKITKDAGKYLEDGGYLAFEIGYDQGEKVKEIMEKYKFHVMIIGKDYGGKDRIIIGSKIGE